MKAEVMRLNGIEQLNGHNLLMLKAAGFSDRQIARWRIKIAAPAIFILSLLILPYLSLSHLTLRYLISLLRYCGSTELVVRRRRLQLGVMPFAKVSQPAS